MWRGVADMQAATGVLQMFVNVPIWQTSGTFGDGVRKLQRRIFSSVVSTETVSKAKTCRSKLEHVSTCSANGDCGVETRLCTCFSSWLGYDCSVEKVDHPDFSISPRVIYHELNLYTTFHGFQNPSCCPPMYVTVLSLGRTTFTTRTQ